jgi:hypothetical protein
MALPKPYVDHSYRTEPVDLQPYGNTISVTSISDNPFEDDQEAEIFTQQSGGMAGPDPKQRSKRVMHKGTATKAKQLPAGHARVYKTRQAANRQGFMPGFGGFGDTPNTTPSIDADEGNPPGFVPASGGAPAAAAPGQAAAPSGVWGALTSLFNAAPGTAAAIEQARAGGPKPAGMPPGMPLPPPGKSSGIMKDLPYILGAAGLIGAGILIFGRKKAATTVATNPRRRRHRR